MSNVITNKEKPETFKLLQDSYLFEISWEVCNKVGGIYTVLRSKVKEAIKYFGNDKYILIGPMLETNRHFVEDDTNFSSEIAKTLRNNGINCKVGHWDSDGMPIVILVDFKNRYTLDLLLYNLWSDFKVDSLASNYDYQEPILFATAAAEAIEILVKNKIVGNGHAVLAQFHEWLCGAGLLHLKKHCGEVSTIFTTHATVLGRALAGNGISIYNLPPLFDPTVEAKKHGVFAKHSLEKAAAREAHCFTTVSSLTADEAYLMLGKYPDKIVFNGLDVQKKQLAGTENIIGETRRKLREIASKVRGTVLPENTLLWLTSGRYEFHNKGFNVLLKSLAQLDAHLPNNSPPIVMFFLVASNWHTSKDSLLDSNFVYSTEQKNEIGIATHRLYDANNDSIIKACIELNLKQKERKIHIIYSDAYLNGSDGVFDMAYEHVLAACDLSIFPSFYEPWGYTPLESIAQTTPTVTTDLAGFGNWVNSLTADYQDAVYVLERKNKSDIEFTNTLTDCLNNIVKNGQNPEYVRKLRTKALAVASLADWSLFYKEYLNAYYQALEFNEIYNDKFDVTLIDSKTITTIHEAQVLAPRFRTAQYDSPLPKELSELRELAYNFWWSWHDSAKILFQKINPELWDTVRHNPVFFLNQISHASLQKIVADKDYMNTYEKNMAVFRDYRKKNQDIINFCNTTAVNDQHPIAYFCMEYGIDECLPIYSGGLGILAGDYLKAMSDLKVPFVAIGLFYKQGYFLQNINTRGNQIALYETWNTNQIPMKPMLDDAGKFLLVGVDLLGRNVYAKVWETKVGHVKLYLLDTDVPENTDEDREITNSLYGGSREIRLKQEIVLGIGGTRFILEKLKITPALYHLNEGHSALLLLERIRNYHHQGLTIDEAIELVRCTSAFTTHTPVPAGNEEFSEDLITKYFSSYVQRIGITLDNLFALAQSGNSSQQSNASKTTNNINVINSSGVRSFSMTTLALRLCLYSNAVSTLHGKVARMMWQSVWPGLLEDEVPIGHITNGVHLGTWVGANMRSLYDDYLGSNWENKQDSQQLWKKMMLISDKEIWKARQAQKNNLIVLIKKLILQQYALRNESKQLISSSINCLNSNVLLLGLARRFTSYKRNDLILKDKERLARILTDEKRPIVMLIAGKSHPADGSGSDLIREVIETTRDPRFKGHIIFLEEYNIALAKALVQGIDVWINTPILGREACGTSGMKAGVNGGLNFSTKDGWWEEAYNSRLGWEIESMVSIADLDKRNDIENMFLLNTLESDIAALYYNNQKNGFNVDWVNKVKASIALISCEYNTTYMAKNYINKIYCPIISQADKVTANDYNELKEIVAWKHGIADRFNTVKIKAILLDGIKDGKIISQGMVKVKLLLFSGKLTARELRAELILVKTDGKQFIDKPIIIQLQQADSSDVGILSYTAEYKIEDTGFYSYGIRVFPYNDKLLRRQDAGIMYWG